jgi:hypothetical protein
MTVLASAPPRAALEAARTGVSRLLVSPGAVSRAAISADARPNLAAPHQVFHLPLGDVSRMRVADDARAVGWRFMVVDESRALGAVEVRERREEPGGYAFSHFNSGPFVGSTVEALGRLEEMDQEPHDLRLLDVPALYVQALWLHGDTDRYMPLQPSPDPLEPYRLYPAGEFASVLARLAALRVEGPALAP